MSFPKLVQSVRNDGPLSARSCLAEKAKRTVDALGKKIDSGIKDVMIALWLRRFIAGERHIPIVAEVHSCR